ncbi:MAG TPA: ATP-dependent DNA helicase [Legionella sp.]|nr:ATP-dependent DNA helicase [Legionella sp.]
MLDDGQERARATDPKHSFIVQAPAGSGKTEILTQRYLRLLSTVTDPEQIIALTFTRKAANEMRERILRAMQQVAAGAVATSAHQQQTYAFAAEALARDHALDWQLLQQPNRLRIITIDALCQMLTQAIPLQDQQIHYAQISEKPRVHYQAAAMACLAFALEHPAYHDAIKTLLAHVDNQQDQLLSLWASMLGRRDQWLPSLYLARTQDKAQYEAGLAWIEAHELTRFRQTIPKVLADELTILARKLACIEAKLDSPRLPLRDWYDFDALDSHLVASLSTLLLTSQNTLRKGFDHHVGLKRGECSDQEYDEIKSASKHLLAALDALPDFLDALLRVKKLPEPSYNPEQWAVLQALLTLLPVLTAHLSMAFHEHNEVDFSAISQQALMALGDEDSHTDLALYLDHRIHHILVDEFQDTSIQQFQLLQQLVYGWQPDDGKTLFIVGDPMQSIYRFRAAEVGLFLRARDHGIGEVSLIPLALRCNFRSAPAVVDWVNDQFKSIFPATDDVESGAVSYHASTNVKPVDEHSMVSAIQCASRAHEAAIIVQSIAYELEAFPNDNIAILVRSRGQLTDIVAALREQNIPFQGVDIDLLAHLPHLRDVWVLTQALLMPANRLAWLAFLRSPWCGLSLPDLHALANHAPSQSIYMALGQLEKIAHLTDDGRARAGFVYTVMHTALAERYQHALVDSIINTLNQLHITHILTAHQQDDLEQYWLLLERFEQDGQIEDMDMFSNEFNALYSQKVTPARVQIMTIHKSKGLEFDCVILPGLGSKSSSKDTPLLRWLKFPTDDKGELLLLSPMKAAHHEQCLLYDYLGQLDAQKNDYERQRLLYVAVTRAKRRLYLLDSSQKSTQGSFRSLLQSQAFTDESTEENQASETKEMPDLFHLPVHYYQQAPAHATGTFNTSALVIHTNTTPRLIGVVAHELLQWICTHHPETLDEIPWALARHPLISMGLNVTDVDIALQQIKQNITALFNDPKGVWLMKRHEQERNEYELLTHEHGEVVTRIIDRTFIENGVRWIIDFKTGRSDTKTQTHHREQVNEYAMLLASRSPAPIRCGLYYLNSGTWVDWEIAL